MHARSAVVLTLCLFAGTPTPSAPPIAQPNDNRTPAGTVADSASFQEGLANVEAVVRSARAFIYETWNDAWATLSRGDKLSVRQNSLIRLALAHGTWSAHEAALFAYKAAGTAAG